MKKCFLVVLIAALLSGRALAVELPADLTNALSGSAENLLGEIDFSGTDGFLQGVGRIAEQAGEQVGDILRQRTRDAAAVLLVVILCGAAGGFCQDSAKSGVEVLPMAGVLSISLLTAGGVDTLIGLGAETVRELALFSKVLLPTLAAATATAGALVTASVQQVTTVFLVDMLLNLINRILIPMVYLYIGMLTASCCMQDSRLTLVAETIKKALTWVLAAVLMGFTAYLSVVQVISGATDGTQVKLARTAISGVVPVVGKIIADAAETVLLGAGMLRNTIGIFGMLAIFAVCIHSFLQLGVQYLVYKFTAFLSGMIGTPEIRRLIDGLAGAFGLVLGMTGACALLLLISVLASVAAVIP